LLKPNLCFQTWEDPHYKNPDTHAKGDNDPLDACEIGRAVAKPGDVKQVKALGILGLIDSGETDWKVIVIDVHDPLAEKLHSLDDVEKHLPGLLDATRDWFRIYMVPDGYPPNEYAFDGKFRDAEYVLGLTP
jgi:inorganic pyrophosphatase